MVSKAIGEGNIQAVSYFVAQKYVAALEAIASIRNQKVILMPLEAASVIGSVAGLAEIAQEAFSDDGSPREPAPKLHGKGRALAPGNASLLAMVRLGPVSHAGSSCLTRFFSGSAPSAL